VNTSAHTEVERRRKTRQAAHGGREARNILLTNVPRILKSKCPALE